MLFACHLLTPPPPPPPLLLLRADIQRLNFSEEALDEDDECLEDTGLVDGAEIALLLDIEGGAKGDSRYKKSTVRPIKTRL